MIVKIELNTANLRDALALQAISDIVNNEPVKTTDQIPVSEPTVKQEVQSFESLVPKSQFEAFPTQPIGLYRNEICDMYNITDGQFSRLQAGKYGPDNILKVVGKDSQRLIYEDDGSIATKISNAKTCGRMRDVSAKAVQSDSGFSTAPFDGLQI